MFNKPIASFVDYNQLSKFNKSLKTIEKKYKSEK